MSERFELGRNFANKLWNAARFSLINLEGCGKQDTGDRDKTSTAPTAPRIPHPASLLLEDRWLLSRLSTVTHQVTDALEHYRYADAARTLYDFAWNEFCSFYVEMAKGRLQDTTSRPTAQRVLAHTLDTLLRLLHPIIPFITEEVWQLLGQAAPERGLTGLESASASVMIAPWPEAELIRQDSQIEARFARFQELLNKLRDTRSRHNIPPKTPMQFAVRCDNETAGLLKPMAAYFDTMAGASATTWGPAVEAPATSASFLITCGEVFVDLADHIDLDAEIVRKTKELARLAGAISGKQRQLANESFVSRAPAEVIEKERAALAQLEELQTATQTALATLEARRSVARLNAWRNALTERRVNVMLPKFAMTFEARLGKTLKAMGMAEALTWPGANFAGFDGDPNWFYIDEVIHKAYVEVNERGTEAAAATAVVMMLGGMPAPPPVFRADHPFLFLIQERQTGSILFIGRATDPTSSGQ